MSFKLADRVKQSAGLVGTGDITLNATITGYRSFADIGDGNSTEYLILAVDDNGIPLGNWEVGIGVYTASGTTLSRAVCLTNSAGTGLLQSGAGTKINFAAGTKHVSCGVGRATSLPQQVFQARISLDVANAVSTNDQFSNSSLYLLPYGGNRVSINNNGIPILYHLPATALSISLTGSTGQIKDVFLYDNAGTLTMELSAAWASATARTDSLTLVDGVEYKSDSALNKLLIGTIRFTGTNVTEDSAGGGVTQVGGKRFVWNRYNRVLRTLHVIDTSDSWTEATFLGSWVQANYAAGTGNKVEYVCGLALEAVHAIVSQSGQHSSASAVNLACGIGVDVTNAYSGHPGFGVGSTSLIPSMIGHYWGQPGIGYHYLAWILNAWSSGTTTWYGDAASTVMQSGLSAGVWC